MENGTIETVYVVSAASGAGKTSLLRALIEQDSGLAVSVSHTTRTPRSAERDGVDYHFVDDDQFVDLIDKNAFVEHAHVFDRRYGTSWAAIQLELEQGHDVLLEIDWQGARQVRERLLNVVSIFILPPSLGALEQRLRARNQDSDEVIARRMAAAVAEMQHCTEYDYLVVNDDFEQALTDLNAIIQARRLQLRRQLTAQAEIISALLEQPGSG
ncbi:MAG: guanylate kinase [Gammaproteobacteria bacterium]|nr:guanylate kinase [Gammaproteobacteria bacterium]